MSKTVAFPLPITGVDMLSSETALSSGAVRSADNVDIGRAGRFALRAGYTRRLAVPGLHSLFHSPQRGLTVVARDDVLQRLDTGSFTLIPFFPLHSADKLEYAEYNGNVYFTNATTIGWVPHNSGTPRAVGVPTPDQPTLAATPNGDLTPGTYGVCITVIDDRGEESGSSVAQTIHLPNGGGVSFTNLPQRAQCEVAIYMTAPDGESLHRAAVLPAVFGMYAVGEVPTGAELTTMGLDPMPPGEHICWHNGRLVTARGDVVYVSEPLRPHLHDSAYGVIPFSGYVSFIASVGDGLFVGDARGVWYLGGKDPVKFAAVQVSTALAVRHSSVMTLPEHFPEKKVQADAPIVVWLSTSGYIAGLPGGATVELHPDRVIIQKDLTGRSIFLLRNGRKQIITAVNSATTTVSGTATNSVIP